VLKFTYSNLEEKGEREVGEREVGERDMGGKGAGMRRSPKQKFTTAPLANMNIYGQYRSYIHFYLIAKICAESTSKCCQL